jgi:hypothetical protein
MKRSPCLATPLLAVLLMAVWAFAQEDMTVIDNTIFDQPRRPPALFPHDVHNENAGIDACGECHHLYEDGQLLEDESSEDMRCADCHAGADIDRQPSLVKAFHLNCKGCHERSDQGPVMCGECHVKGFPATAP